MGPTGPLSIRGFFDGVREGRLVVQRCAACGVLAVPPRTVCAGCEGSAWTRVPLGGDGEVASFTVIRVPPSSFQAQAPYAIAVVRMAEGVALTGRLAGVAEDALRVGLPVRFAPGAEPPSDRPVIAFRAR